jgi:hypothetical protein
MHGWPIAGLYLHICLKIFDTMVQKNSQKLAAIAATWTAGLTGEFLLLAQGFSSEKNGG